MKKKVNALYYEEIGDDFDAFMSEYDVKARIELINTVILTQSVKGSCLEIGCGTGRISKMLATHFDDLTVSDISPKLCITVAEKYSIAALASDACALEVKNESFDCLVSSECVEHTPNPKLALQEMARILKPGGKLIVTTPNKLWYPALALAKLLRIRKYAGTENWIFPSNAVHILEASGMSIDLITGCHLFPWQIPGAKKVLPFFDKFGINLYPIMINFAICATKKSDNRIE